MKKFYSTIRGTFKLCALVILTMTGLQNVSAQTCHVPGTIAVSISGNSYTANGEEVVNNLQGYVVDAFTMRLDGMNGPIVSNPLSCELLLGEPREIWVNVSFLDPLTNQTNSCMSSFIIQDKSGPSITCPTKKVDCFEDYPSTAVVPDGNNMESLESMVYADDACSDVVSLVANASSILSYTDYLHAFSSQNSTQVGTVMFNNFAEELVMVGAATEVSVCWDVPANGTLTFSHEHTGTANDSLVYTINDTTIVNITTNNVGTTVDVDACSQFCYILHSDGGTTHSAEFTDFSYAFDAPNSCDNEYRLLQWTATDIYGNSSNCLQFQVKDKTAADSLPPHTSVTCTNFNASSYEKDANGNPAVSETGFPFGCNMNYTYTDLEVNQCGTGVSSGCRKINRTFHIVSGSQNCLPITKTTHLQQISIVDTVGPVMTFPSDPNHVYENGVLIIDTDAADCIASNYTLPVPNTSDDCSTVQDYTVVSTSGTISNNVLQNVTPGAFSLIYRVEDCCGNVTQVTVPAMVVDNAPPTPVCESFRNVSLTSDGTGRILAQSFDDGSHDNCNPVWFKVLRVATESSDTPCSSMNGDDDPAVSGDQIYFDDEAYFCCEDLNQSTVQVILRVFDVNPGAGPIDPSRMDANATSGNDLVGHYNDCETTVTVMDNIAPSITCPTSVTVGCDFWFDIDNLAATFGTVRNMAADQTTFQIDADNDGLDSEDPSITDGLATGNCMTTITELDPTEVAGCGGERVITRTFRVGNGAQMTTCTQTITVGGSEYVFDESNFDWNFEANQLFDLSSSTECTPNTDTSNTSLPQPTIDSDGYCGLISVTFSDVEFPAEAGSCTKIERTWKVRDICICPLTHSSPTIGVGYWERKQIIEVKNSDAPVFTTCMDTSLACGATATTLVQSVSDLCSIISESDISVSIQYDGTSSQLLVTFIYNSADSTVTVNLTNLPTGTHQVIWKATDGCNNTGQCVQDVTVGGADTEPPVGDVISVTSSTANQTFQAFVTANDNCDTDLDYTYTFEIVGGATLADLSTTGSGTGSSFGPLGYLGVGTVNVTFTITDDAGLTDTRSGSTALDPPSPQTATISGAISDAAGQMVENVEVDAGIGYMSMTDNNGTFDFTPVETNQDYSIEPTKDDDPRNGLSTLDLVLIARHIIGIEPLPTAHKMIAADVTNDENVDVFDLIELQKLLIWDIPTFTNNSSWRFVESTFSFPDPTNPWASSFPEEYAINGLTNDMLDIDFTGIKIGDVSGNATANSIAPAQPRTVAGTFNIEIQNQNLSKGDVTTIDFVAAETSALNGIQLTLDLGKLALENYKAGVINVDALTIVNGQYVMSTATSRPTIVEAGDVLFSLNVTADFATTIAQELQVNNSLLTSEVYAGNDILEVLDANIQMISDQPISDVLYQNRPNPFKQNTTIGFYLTNGGNAKLSVFDVSGRQLYYTEGTFNAGYNQIVLTANDLQGQGVMYYQLDTDNFTANRKMIIVK